MRPRQIPRTPSRWKQGPAVNWSRLEGKHLIYETMVFSKDEDGSISYGEEIRQDRYYTEQEAKLGHERTVEEIRSMGGASSTDSS